MAQLGFEAQYQWRWTLCLEPDSSPTTATTNPIRLVRYSQVTTGVRIAVSCWQYALLGRCDRDACYTTKRNDHDAF